MMSKLMSAALAASLIARPALADGWKTAGDKPGKCHVQVPANWKPGDFGLGMVSPDGADDIDISSSPASLAEAKMVASSTFSVDTVIEDSSARYFVTIADREGKPLKHYYVAVPGPGYTCALTVDWDQSFSDADAKTIALSLKPR